MWLLVLLHMSWGFDGPLFGWILSVSSWSDILSCMYVYNFIYLKRCSASYESSIISYIVKNRFGGKMLIWDPTLSTIVSSTPSIPSSTPLPPKVKCSGRGANLWLLSVNLIEFSFWISLVVLNQFLVLQCCAFKFFEIESKTRICM